MLKIFSFFKVVSMVSEAHSLKYPTCLFVNLTMFSKQTNPGHSGAGLWEGYNLFKFCSQVTDVSGEPEAYLNDHNDQVGRSRNYLDQNVSVSKPLYLPG